LLACKGAWQNNLKL